MVPDIFMVLYEKEMKEAFGRHGGFQRFLEYVNNHEYLELKCIKNYHISSCDPNAAIPEGLRKRMEILREEKELLNNFKFEDAEKDLSSFLWAEMILGSARIEPSFLSDADLKVKLCEQKITEMAEQKKILEAEVRKLEINLERCLNSDSATNDAVRQMADNEGYESIVEAVIRCSHSKISDHTNKKNRIRKEADDILKNLKDKIEPLFEVLDEYDKDGIF